MPCGNDYIDPKVVELLKKIHGETPRGAFPFPTQNVRGSYEIADSPFAPSTPAPAAKEGE